MATRATDAMLWLSRAWCEAENAVAGPGTAVESGILPDANHTSGYHVSRKDNPAGNYSIVRADDRAGCGPDDAAAAIDMTFKRTADLVACYARLSAVWLQRATHPAARYLNAFNGWDGHGSAGRKDLVSGAWSASDTSHKWHIHLEIRRRYVEDWDAMRTLLAVLAPGGGTMTADFSTTDPYGAVTGDGTMLVYLRHLVHAVLTGEQVDRATDNSVMARLARIEDAVGVQPDPAPVTLSDEDLVTLANLMAARIGDRLSQLESAVATLLRAVARAGEDLGTVDDEVKQ